jgi:hypothetical protein
MPCSVFPLPEQVINLSVLVAYRARCSGNSFSFQVATWVAKGCLFPEGACHWAKLTAIHAKCFDWYKNKEEP